MKWALSGFCLLAASCNAMAQTNIDVTNKFAWTENTGWINFRDANGGASGVKVNATFLQGFAWGENIGWVNFGDGSPSGGTSYGNADGSDFGVNRDAATDALSGLAWGENVGWINFTVPSLPAAQQPRISLGRLRGYAWGENIGWLNLDVAVAGQFVGIVSACNLADITGIGGPPSTPDGLLTGDDFNAFIAAFANGDPLADVCGIGGPPSGPDGLVTGDDFNAFIAAFAAGCP